MAEAAGRAGPALAARELDARPVAELWVPEAADAARGAVRGGPRGRGGRLAAEGPGAYDATTLMSLCY